MKLKVSRLREAYNALLKVKAEKLPAKLSFRLSVLASDLENVYNKSEDAKNSLIIDKYGVKDDKDNMVVPEGKIKDFLEEYNTILSEEVEIKFTPLNVELFEGLNLSIEFFAGLKEFISED